MKIIKLLFSKIFISALALMVQVALIITVLVFFESYFALFQIFSTVLGCVVLLSIINKKENPEFKLPWLTVVLILPFFGVAIYCMFANAKMPHKQFLFMVETACRCKKYCELTPAENREINDFLGDCAGIENYLRRNSFSRGYLNCEVKYLKSGEDFYLELLKELNSAEKFIFLEYFIIDYGKMWDGVHKILKRKVKEGVEVRVIYDDIGCAGLLRSNFYKKLRKEGIGCVKFNRFMPVISGIHNNRDHRKIAVIDGKCAFTGGVNIGDEYINQKNRFGHWKDTAIKVRGEAVNNFTVLFLQTYDSVTKQHSELDKYFSKDFEKFENAGFIHPFGDGPKPIYKELVGSNNFINLINAAKNYIYISTPYLIPDYNLLSALRAAAYKGVDVRIITPAVPDKKIVFNITRSNYKYLLQAGVKIYEYSPGFIHAKGMICDGTLGFVGTINLDYRSLVHHYECGAVLYKTPCLADIEKDFTETLSVSKEITQENFKMSFAASLANAVFNLFSPML